MKFAMWLTFGLFVWAPAVGFSVFLFVGGLLSLGRGICWVSLGVFAGPAGVFLTTWAAEHIVDRLTRRG